MYKERKYEENIYGTEGLVYTNFYCAFYSPNI